MHALDLAKRLLTTSAILVFGAIAISVVTRDEWLTVAHAAGIVSAVIAAIGVVLLIATGLHRLGVGLERRRGREPTSDHELGQTGWD